MTDDSLLSINDWGLDVRIV